MVSHIDLGKTNTMFFGKYQKKIVQKYCEDFSKIKNVTALFISGGDVHMITTARGKYEEESEI